ncbi:MAG TPA: cupin domain-containing protein [Chloroflexota bacterium]|jgi:mannose-6-phosphate isomerase-like protein (cupin superfamily)
METESQRDSGAVAEQGGALLLRWTDLGPDGTGGEFQGFAHGDIGASFIIVDAPPGGGPRLHRHPYAEIFLILEGTVTFTAGADVIEAGGGQMVVVPAGMPHKFVNSGTGRLRQVDIHPSNRFVTEWLED